MAGEVGGGPGARAAGEGTLPTDQTGAVLLARQKVKYFISLIMMVRFSCQRQSSSADKLQAGAPAYPTP